MTDAASSALSLKRNFSNLEADWCPANPAARALLDLVAEILAEEYIARMKATAPKLEDQPDESSDLRQVQF
ncbi:MAG: hypothetical protein ACYC9Y_04405 [Candidatus Methylomirabilia bacterium]